MPRMGSTWPDPPKGVQKGVPKGENGPRGVPLTPFFRGFGTPPVRPDPEVSGWPRSDPSRTPLGTSDPIPPLNQAWRYGVQHRIRRDEAG